MIRVHSTNMHNYHYGIQLPSLTGMCLNTLRRMGRLCEAPPPQVKSRLPQVSGILPAVEHTAPDSRNAFCER
jgi:hypothetical protein